MKKIHYIILILLIAFVVISFMKKDKDPEEAVVVEEEEVAVDLEFAEEGKLLYEETDKYLIKGRTPILDNRETESRIRDYVDGVVSDFETFFDGQEDLELPEGRKYSMNISYETKDGEGYTTYVFYIETDTGGAHPNVDIHTMTFDESGIFFDLNDYLEIESYTENAAEKISKAISDELSVQLGDQFENGWIEDGAGPVLENFNDFYFGKDKIYFLFAPYQIGPYSWGLKEVGVPLDIFIETKESVEESVE